MEKTPLFPLTPPPEATSPLLPPEDDDLTPMPEDDLDQHQTPHPASLPPPPHQTHPTHSHTQTAAADHVSPTPTPTLPNNSNNTPPPHQSPPTTSPIAPYQIPPLMQQQSRNSPTFRHPLQSRSTARRTSLPPSSTNLQVNTRAGARFNSFRRSRQTFTSDRAPVRRSARLSQTTPVPNSSSQP